MRKRELCSYYHVCTDGNELSWMFKDDEDFRNGDRGGGVGSTGEQ